MMSSTFIIAEAGSSHDGDIEKAYRLIEAAKECGSDAVKFQMCSDPAKMAKRRNAPEAEAMYRKYILPVVEWLPKLKAKCDEVGIEFMCTAYIPEDIHTIAPLVKRFKISAFESTWKQFIEHHMPYHKPTIISCNEAYKTDFPDTEVITLYCVSKYPCPLEDVHLDENLWSNYKGRWRRHDGFSDHTGNILTGAVAVGVGARYIEAHIKLHDTPENNPDFPHSLIACTERIHADQSAEFGFRQYVENVRQAERML